jgi:putative ubiquitin-RnfH superfamily antitoxin RatB of RatAB toxin-antitoxin module
VPRLRIEVVYALAGAQECVRVELAPGAVAADAVAASGLPLRHRLPQGYALGSGGRAIPPGHVLQDGERVEILRPLAMDPKEARRRRARSAGR